MIKAMKCIGQILQYTKVYKLLYISAFIFLLISSVAGIASPYFIMKIFDNALTTKSYSLLFQYILLALLCTIVQNGFRVVSDYLFARIGRGIVVDLRAKCLDHIYCLSGEELVSLDSGDTYTTLFDDIENVQHVVTNDLIGFISDVLMSLGMVVFLAWLQWDLLSIILVIQLGMFYIQKRINGVLQKQSNMARDYSGALNSLIQEILTNIVHIIHIGGRAFFSSKHNISEKLNMKAALNIQLLLSSSMGFFSIITSFIVLFILGFGGYKVFIGTLTIGGLLTFNVYSQRLVTPLLRVTQFNMKMIGAVVSWQRITNLLQKNAMPSGNVSLKTSCREVIIEHLSFGYKSKPVFKDINVSFKPGQVHALVGVNGSGKSTIVNLLLRLWDPQMGTISLGDKDINTMDINNLRSMISIVSQNVYLCNDSIYNNIVLGRSDVSEESVIKVLKEADAFDFVEQLPDKMHTFVGEKGLALSGGQRQKISISRALLHAAPILIFDEATSMIDNIAEENIISNILQKEQSCVKIVITHRLSTIAHADVIHVVGEGQILEEGSYENLMNKKEHFYRLFVKENNLVTY